LNKVTAIIPTFNEESNISRALQSVTFADEIIVIDSYSTDKTVDIVKNTPSVKLLERVFDDFSSQKNYAIDQAKFDWIFILDADEELNEILTNQIKEKLINPDGFVGFSFNRDFFFMNKKIQYGGYSNNKVVRLFDRKFCRYNGNLVHEKIAAKGDVGEIKEPMQHWSYKGFEEHLTKVVKYKSFQAEELFEKGKKSNILMILLKPKFRFFVHYILKLGFLDGFQGFIIAMIQSYGVFVKYVKLRLLNKGLK